VNEHDPGEVSLQARNVAFDWSETPLHWMPKEPIASHSLSALNLLLPEGERWFCATYTEALPLIADAKLREDVLGFIGQEAMHAETHNVVLYDYLDAHGVDPRPFTSHSEYLMRKVLGPRPALSARAQKQQLVGRIAMIGAIEHLTAFLGDYALNSRWDDFDGDPAMVDLYRWHGAEEVEHRNVAHDVATYFGVGYFRRNFSMLIAFVGFIVLMLRGTRFIVRQDPTLTDRGYLVLWLQWLGAMRRGSLPSLAQMTKGVARYLKPSYTPEDEGDTAQAVAYLAKSPAARSALP
jgi:predicted metal-dependent hydrolase